MRTANIVSSIIGMLFSATAFFITFTFKQFKNVPVGPEFFPRMLAIGLFFCCLALFIQSILDKNNKTSAKTLNPKNKDMQRMLIGLAVVVVAICLWLVTGFIITTPFTLFVLMRILGKKNWKVMIIISILATVVVFLAFKFLLGIDMPMGLLE